MVLAISKAMLLAAVLTGVCHSAISAEDFSGKDLKNKDFKKTTGLNNANFSDAVLDRADFASTSIKKANFKGAALNLTNFCLADATEANFTSATGYIRFSGTTLNKANLEGLTLSIDVDTKFRGANLKKTIINGNFWGCDLSEADLRGSSLRGVTIAENTRFKGALYDDDTAWPDGFDPKAAGAVFKAADAKEEKKEEKKDDKLKADK